MFFCITCVKMTSSFSYRFGHYAAVLLQHCCKQQTKDEKRKYESAKETRFCFTFTSGLMQTQRCGRTAKWDCDGMFFFCGFWYRWSSGLMLHGTIVDGARAALLLPLGFSVLRCQPVTRCSLVDTAFLLLATVTSLNLLTAALSDAPLLPPPVLVPTLLQSAGYTRSQNRYASPLYPKGAGATSYYSVIPSAFILNFHNTFSHFLFHRRPQNNLHATKPFTLTYCY